MTAYEAINELKSSDVNPSELFDAALERVVTVEPSISATPTLYAERDHALILLWTQDYEKNIFYFPLCRTGLSMHYGSSGHKQCARR